MFVIDDNGSPVSGEIRITSLPVVPEEGEMTILPFPMPGDDGVFTILPFPMDGDEGVVTIQPISLDGEMTILPFPMPGDDGVFTILPFEFDFSFDFDFSNLGSITLDAIDLSSLDWNGLLQTDVSQLLGFGFQSFVLDGDALTLTLLDGSTVNLTLGDLSVPDVGAADGGRLMIDPSGLSGAVLDGFNAGWI